MSYSQVNLTEGAGPKASATDDIGGKHYQIVKFAHGAEGEAKPVDGSNPLPTQDGGAMSLLSRILQMLMAPLGFDKSLSRQRVTGIIESGTVTTVSTVTTVTTLSTLSNVAAIGGYSAQMQVMDTNRTAWAQSVRARIT